MIKENGQSILFAIIIVVSIAIDFLLTSWALSNSSNWNIYVGTNIAMALILLFLIRKRR